MRSLWLRISTSLVLSLFGVSTAFVVFQNCAPVRFGASDASSEGATSASCDPTVYGVQPYTNGTVNGTCSCVSPKNPTNTSVSTIMCTATSCVDSSATFSNGVCVGPGVTSLTVLINGQSSVSLLPSTSPVPLTITPTGAITSLTSQSGISKIGGTCSVSTITPALLGVPSGALNLGSQTFVYDPTIALGMKGCSWRITGVANNGQSGYADFTALLCTAGAADPANPTCTTADGKAGSTSCTADGLSYQCIANAPTPAKTCTFNNTVIQDGGSVTAYPTSTVGYGAICTGETRVCSNGALSGSSPYSTCLVTPGASCSFNGQQVADGGSVTGYATASVPYGSVCSSGPMTCHNGNLTGSDPYASCTVQGNPNCSVNGQSLLNGQSLVLYQSPSVVYGSSCQAQTLLCNNGTITGDNGQGYYTASSCSVQAPVNCNFNGQTVANGGGVTAWQNTVVGYGSTCSSEYRQCVNGSLSGSFAYNSCTVTPGNACSYNGQQVTSGATISGYSSASVAYGSSCQASSATCNSGTLSASIYPTCSVGQPANCTFNGLTVANGASVTGYSATQVEPGQTCAASSRTCSNGVLSGDTNYQYSSCTVRAPNPCVFQGTTYADGQTVTGYFQTSVGYGGTCSSEARICHDGTLSGSAPYPACVVSGPASCTFNGQSVAHGQSVTAYNSASGVTCSSETATCNNGSLPLDGGYTYGSCTVTKPSAYLLSHCGKKSDGGGVCGIGDNPALINTVCQGNIIVDWMNTVGAPLSVHWATLPPIPSVPAGARCIVYVKYGYAAGTQQNMDVVFFDGDPQPTALNSSEVSIVQIPN